MDSVTGDLNNPWEIPADVRVAEMSAGDKFHHKYWVIDDIVITGSLNASASGAFGNDENTLFVYDWWTALQYSAAFETRFNEASPLK